MYTDKRKLLYGIILLVVAIFCVGAIIGGQRDIYYFIGTALGVYFGFIFIRDARPSKRK